MPSAETVAILVERAGIAASLLHGTELVAGPVDVTTTRRGGQLSGRIEFGPFAAPIEFDRLVLQTPNVGPPDIHYLGATRRLGQGDSWATPFTLSWP